MGFSQAAPVIWEYGVSDQKTSGHMKSPGKIHWASNCFTKKHFGLGKFNTLKYKDREKDQNKLCSLVMHWPCKTFTFLVLQGKYSELSVTVVLRK